MTVEEWSSWAVLLYLAAFFTVSWLMWPPTRRWLVARNIPGPRGYPLVGSALKLQGSTNYTFTVLLDWFNKFGPIFKTWSFLNLTVFITEPADIKLILGNKKFFNRSEYFMSATVYFVGSGIVTSGGEKWRKHRKALNPMFQTQLLESFVDVFVQKTNQVCAQLDPLADGRTLDCSKYISCITIETICRTVIGYESESFPGEDDGMLKLYDMVIRCDELVHARVFYPWLMVPWLQHWFKLGREAKSLREAVSSYMEAMYSRHSARPPSGRVTSMLDLTKTSTAITPKGIKNEILGVALAGFGTTAIGLSFLLMLLGIHQDVQDDIFTELQEVFLDDPRPVTVEDLSHLKALERAIKETLRLFPSVSLIPREIPEDLKLSSGYVIPAGSNVMLFSYLTHRNERYFPEPHTFLPDRWLPGNRPESHPFDYIPFGAGVRNCIGQRYAMLQMKSVACTLLRRFRITTNCSMEDLNHISLSVTLKMDSRYLVQLHKR